MMTQDKSLEKLAQLLERHGADAARWPDTGRAAMQTLIRTNPAAKALADEAAALERVLDAAPPLGGTKALESGILALISEPEDTRAGAQLIAFPEPGTTADHSAGRWGAAALLAASLLVGIWVGAGGYAESLVRAPLEAAGLDMSDQISSYYVGGISPAEDLL